MFEIKVESAFRLNFSIYEKYRENVDFYVHCDLPHYFNQGHFKGSFCTRGRLKYCLDQAVKASSKYVSSDFFLFLNLTIYRLLQTCVLCSWKCSTDTKHDYIFPNQR